MRKTRQLSISVYRPVGVNRGQLYTPLSAGIGHLTKLRVLQHQTATQSKNDSQGHRNAEGEEEDADTVEEGEDVDFLAVELREGSAGWEGR